jgi:hypothetical protein
VIIEIDENTYQQKIFMSDLKVKNFSPLSVALTKVTKALKEK